MNTREIAKEYRLGHWSSIMQERNASGMSVRTYCQQSGIRENVYYYWQRKLREAACREMLPADQVELGQAIVPSGWAVCESANPIPEESAVTIEIGKFRLKVGADTTPGQLEKICRVLMSLC